MASRESSVLSSTHKNCPSLHAFLVSQFTITSAPNDPYVSVHIRQVGDWTQALGERLGAGPSVVAALTSAAMKGSEKGDSIGRGDFVEIDTTLENRELPVIRIDGPYGAPAEEFSSCEVAVLIGAGIGVTPFASILKHIWYRQKRGDVGSLKRVEFFWVCRDTPSFGWFQTLLQEVEAAQADPNFLRINIYLTQKIGEDMLWNIAINDAGADYDPLTLLRSRTMFGRPDWKSIFGKMREAIDNGSYLPGSKSQLKTTVGTYFCGPGVLAKAIKKATEEASTSTVEFTFAKVSSRSAFPDPGRFASEFWLMIVDLFPIARNTSDGLVTIIVHTDASPPFPAYARFEIWFVMYTDSPYHHLLDMKKPPYFAAILPRKLCCAEIRVDRTY